MKITEAARLISDFADQAVPRAADSLADKPDALTKLLWLIRKTRVRLQQAESYVESRLIATLDASSVWELDVDGIGKVTRHSGKKRTQWDHERLAGVVAHAIADSELAEPMFTREGEFIDPYSVTEKIVGAFRRAATPSWKVTGLRSLGVTPAAYCDESAGNASIELPKAAPVSVGQSA